MHVKQDNLKAEVFSKVPLMVSLYNLLLAHWKTVLSFQLSFSVFN